MKISHTWLQDHIELNEEVERTADRLTQSGLEVEGLETFQSIEGGLEGVVIGEVLTCEQHPNADKLSKTTVDIGAEVVPIVCGAPNVARGQKVVVATLGCTLYPEGHDPFPIKKAKIRGEVSLGMICAEDELGLGQSHDGILVLDTDLANGTPAAQYFGLENDTVIEIGLTPNRADATSHYGVARELKILLNAPLKTTFEETLSPDEAKNPITITVEAEEACPRYAGVTIEGIQVGPSPDWLQNRLKSIGLAPINNIVDVTNFILHDVGQPLHAFDLAKITTGKVVVKTLPEGTEFVTLDEEKRQLAANDLMICNGDEPMCIAGVFGGLDSGVTYATTSIFLESAYFSPDHVRKTSLHHGLKTDASFRFERGTDPEMPIKGLIKAARLIKEIAGGSITSDVMDHYPQPISPFQVEISLERVFTLIGKTLETEVVNRLLTGLEIKILKKEGDTLLLEVPSYRVDVQREADIVEEIIRLYGYDNIEESPYMHSSFLSQWTATAEKQKERIGAVLAAQGFQEIVTNSLTKPTYTEGSEAYPMESNVEILNKLSEDLGIMRRTPLFSGLEVIAHNVNRKQSNLKMFEFAKTYEKTAEGFEEKQFIALYLTGNETEEHWKHEEKASDFYTLSQAVNSLFQLTNAKSQQEASQHAFLEQGITYTTESGILGHAGFVHEEAREKVGIEQPVLYAEFDWNFLTKKSNKALKYKEVSKFPEVRRDLSLVLDKQVTFDEIQKIARQVEKKLLQRVNVFDVFTGEQLGAGKKAYAISFILQDQHQTLTDKVIDKTMQKFMRAFEQDLGASIRK